MKPAAGGWVGGTRHIAGKHDPAPAAGRLDARNRREQGVGVGMQRRGVEVGRGSLLHDTPQIHHRHVVGDVLHDRQIMRDEQISEAEFPAQFDEQIHHLGLDRDIKGRNRFVEHEEVGLQNKRAGDRDPLPLAAGEFVWVASQGHRWHAGAFEGRRHPPQSFGLVAEPVDDEPFLQDRPHRKPGVQRPIRILKHDLHPPPQSSERSGRGSADVLAVKPHAASGRLDEPENAATGGGLATTAFAHQAEGAAAADPERDAIHGPDLSHHGSEQATADREVGLQIRHGDEFRHGGCHRPADSEGRAASSSPAKWQATK